MLNESFPLVNDVGNLSQSYYTFANSKVINKKPVLIIPVGIPGSGKSKYIDENFQNYQIVCRDDIRLALGDIFNKRVENFVSSITETMMRALMERKKDIVCDETNCILESILKKKKLCEEYNYQFHIIKFNISKKVCMARKLGKNKLTEEIFDFMEKSFLELKDDFLTEISDYFEIVEE